MAKKYRHFSDAMYVFLKSLMFYKIAKHILKITELLGKPGLGQIFKTHIICNQSVSKTIAIPTRILVQLIVHQSFYVTASWTSVTLNLVLLLPFLKYLIKINKIQMSSSIKKILIIGGFFIYIVNLSGCFFTLI